jgi:hypothetical protein
MATGPCMRAQSEEPVERVSKITTIRTRYIVILSFLFTGLFFIEYTPLLRHTHIPFDLEEFHYPLADYAFQAIRHGRFPQWDPTIYCGLSFVGNIQAAVFYPPTWLMFAFNLGQAKLSYQSLENLALAHVWLAFVLCYIWLHHQRRLHPLASIFGAGVFAFSGYMLMELQHFGLNAGYAWMPLGFAGIDAADEHHSVRPLWKVVAASALCFLAGYPFTWVVFSICMMAYACGRRTALWCVPLVACALTGSLLVAAVQFLPTWEATQLAVPQPRYSWYSGIKDPRWFISYFIPNYFDFGLHVPVLTNPEKDYLYLGAPAFVGLAFLFSRKRFADLAPALAVLFGSALFLINPFGLAGRAIEHSKLLAKVFSAYYFAAGLTASLALLTALGLDYGLRCEGRPAPRWLALSAIVLSLMWSVRLITLWSVGGKAFAAGWHSGIDVLTVTILFGGLVFFFSRSSVFFFSRSSGYVRTFTAVAALVLVAAEYKAFGTSKRFNASSEAYPDYVARPFPHLNANLYGTLRRHREYRVALGRTIFPQALRHSGLATPQGYDPLLQAQYIKALIDQVANFRENRLFDIIPESEQTLRLLGVRYFITSENDLFYPRICSSQNFRRLQPDNSYYKVFEFLNALPAFELEDQEGEGMIELKSWKPERRLFFVRSKSGGQFRLTEQFFPGWVAAVDGRETAIERCHGCFQCVPLPPGEHSVEFRYHSRWLAAGGAISLLSVFLVTIVVRWPIRLRGRSWIPPFAL